MEIITKDNYSKTTLIFNYGDTIFDAFCISMIKFKGIDPGNMGRVGDFIFLFFYVGWSSPKIFWG